MKNRKIYFNFSNNYSNAVMNLQPEVYNEIRRIIDEVLKNFFSANKRKPLVLDIGAAGLLPYDTSLAEKITILDLFPKPNDVQLAENVQWCIGDVLSQDIDITLSTRKFDIIVMASLLHHLCDKNNNILMHIDACFRNCRRLLRKEGSIYIFEGTCPATIAKLQDIVYHLYSFLAKILGFAFVRILTFKEILRALSNAGFTAKIVLFTQPRHMAVLFWRVPAVLYPVRISAIYASL